MIHPVQKYVISVYRQKKTHIIFIALLQNHYNPLLLFWSPRDSLKYGIRLDSSTEVFQKYWENLW